ncbi:hypothetical protein GCM10027055_29880 [Janibacter alkaliphilus]|uniref:Putative membrane protein n=1 Tax=Janibacter alkaliphilus TaxID=1069963 RepID=A0A852X6Q2_9MICO|nr:putative membrane protein [Janibacter alkaliphilus]
MTAPAKGPIAGWLLTVCGALGLAAAAILSYEKYRLLENPFYVPSCSVNETVSCTQIMQSAQSSAFGFPNPYLGLVGFAVVLTTGVVVLAGARLARWYWLGLAGGILAGAAFVLWLMYQSIVVIGALCPYCMVVWAVMIVLTGALARGALRARRG